MAVSATASLTGGRLAGSIDRMMPPSLRQEISDEDLARGVSGRGAASQVAFRALYERYRWRLPGFLDGKVAPGDVQDVNQEVWVRVWQHLPTKFDGTNFRAWLFQIARNCAIDMNRRKRPTDHAELADLPDGRSVQPLEVLVGRELEDEEKAHVERLAKCLKELEQQNAIAAALVRGRLAGEDYAVLSTRLQLAAERAHRLFHSMKEQLQRCVEKGNA